MRVDEPRGLRLVSIPTSPWDKKARLRGQEPEKPDSPADCPGAGHGRGQRVNLRHKRIEGERRHIRSIWKIVGGSFSIAGI